MSLLSDLLDFLRNMPERLQDLISQHGLWTYAILFAIIFVETGLVIMPFLPGDSLLFAAGAVGALGKINPWMLSGVLVAAAILGNIVNYAIGWTLGPRILRGENVRFLSAKNLEKAHRFFQKHGAKAVILSRFVPIVRTFVPFAAGIGRMDRTKFLIHNAVGAVLWVGVCVGAGYLFGNIPLIRKNFELVVVAIVVVSMVPMGVELYMSRRARNLATSQMAKDGSSAGR